MTLSHKTQTVLGVLVGLTLLCMPVLVAAATSDFGTAGSLNSTAGGQVNNSNANSFKVDNPLKFNSFCGLLEGLFKGVVAIGIPVAVVFLVIAGFKFVLAQGNPKGIADARKNLLSTIVGIGIFLGAWLIAQVIASTLSQFGVSVISCN